MSSKQNASGDEQPKKKKMLVIDDDSLVLYSCRRIFAEEGYEVITVDNPQEGLDIASKSTFDVILCDWKMPKMNGIELVKMLDGHNPDSAIVMITGFPALERAIEAFKHGVADYIAKPFTPEEIINAVNEALNRKKQVKPE
jgi:DNA-binding NtrC family response regulator